MADIVEIRPRLSPTVAEMISAGFEDGFAEEGFPHLVAQLDEGFAIFVFEDEAGKPWIELQSKVDKPSKASIQAGQIAKDFFDCNSSFREYAIAIAVKASRYYRPPAAPDSRWVRLLLKGEALGIIVAVMDEPDHPLWLDYSVPENPSLTFCSVGGQISDAFHKDDGFRTYVIRHCIDTGRYHRSHAST